MNKTQTNLLTILVVALVAIGVVIFFFSTDKDGIISTFINYGLLLTVVAVVLAILFAILNMLKSPESFKKVLTSLVIFIVILVVSYLLSNGNEVFDAAGNAFAGSKGSVSKWIGTSINYSIILLIIGGSMFLVDMVKNIIK